MVGLRDFPLILLMAEILHQLRLVVFPIIYRVSAPSQVVSQISAINSSALFRLVIYWPLKSCVNHPEMLIRLTPDEGRMRAC